MTSIVISNPDRIIFPDAGHTKADVVAHYERVAPAMLPHLLGRALTLKRYPKGIDGKGFFQKNAAAHFPDYIHRIEMPKRGGVTVHPGVSSGEGIAYLANFGTVAFHVPLGREPKLANPDRMVFDLDPPEEGFERARQAAWAVKALLDDIGVASTPMVTGSKGYHVVVALTPNESSGRIASAARKLAAVMIQRHPELMTDAFRKKRRDGRVFVDWMRNGFRATVIAPWSLRPRSGAPVAVPIRWEELDATAPNAFALRDVDARLALPDPLAELEPTDALAVTETATALAEEHGIVLAPFDRFRG